MCLCTLTCIHACTNRRQSLQSSCQSLCAVTSCFITHDIRIHARICRIHAFAVCMCMPFFPPKKLNFGLSLHGTWASVGMFRYIYIYIYIYGRNEHICRYPHACTNCSRRTHVRISRRFCTNPSSPRTRRAWIRTCATRSCTWYSRSTSRTFWAHATVVLYIVLVTCVNIVCRYVC
jgi:hypothetical protein